MQFLNWPASFEAASTITDLQQRAEDFRKHELERLFNRLDLDDREQELVATMSRRLVNKILRPPTLRLKNQVAQGNGSNYTRVMRSLFSLDKAVG
jgi:glutamyl-tRNA reductase